eukprot:1140828-Pelagomonas_calceolata.AAC.5
MHRCVHQRLQYELELAYPSPTMRKYAFLEAMKRFPLDLLQDRRIGVWFPCKRSAFVSSMQEGARVRSCLPCEKGGHFWQFPSQGLFVDADAAKAHPAHELAWQTASQNS